MLDPNTKPFYLQTEQQPSVINNNIKTQEEVTKGIHTKESDITNTKQDNIISTTKIESRNQIELTIVKYKILPKEYVKHRSLETTC